jgi:hypothetical protein
MEIEIPRGSDEVKESLRGIGSKVLRETLASVGEIVKGNPSKEDIVTIVYRTVLKFGLKALLKISEGNPEMNEKG